MEEKLERYRASVRRREKFDKIKQRFIRMITFTSQTDEKKNEECIEMISEEVTDEQEITDASEIGEQPECWSSEEESNELPENTERKCEDSKYKYITYMLWFCFWVTCWMIAIELKFGTVFFMFSALFGVYFNTRTGPKRKNEISAYSVFNENCKSIKGTLKPEQFENEIRYGPMTVKN